MYRTKVIILFLALLMILTGCYLPGQKEVVVVERGVGPLGSALYNTTRYHDADYYGVGYYNYYGREVFFNEPGYYKYYFVPSYYNDGNY